MTSRPTRLLAACAALIVGPAAVTMAVTAAAPAHAAPVATAMVKTQRMKDANLNSGQVGWYEKGAKLTLQCSKRGQAVKGYFSFAIPNGGWDNLWYKVSDNYFVADVDIETGSNNPVAPDCGTPQPQPQPQPQQPAASAGRTKGATSPGPNPLARFVGECTYGAQEEMKKRTGFYIPALNKHAKFWDDIAQSTGWQVVRNGPQARALVVFEPGVQYADPNNGHVAWVDSVTQLGGKPAVAITEWNYKGQRYPTKRTVAHVPGMSYILIP